MNNVYDHSVLYIILFKVFHFASPLCITVPYYIARIYADLGLIINVCLFTDQNKTVNVHLNPYKSLLFHSSKIINMLCSDERNEIKYTVKLVLRGHLWDKQKVA